MFNSVPNFGKIKMPLFFINKQYFMVLIFPEEEGLEWQFSPKVAPHLLQVARTWGPAHGALVLNIWPAQRQPISSCLCLPYYSGFALSPLFALVSTLGQKEKVETSFELERDLVIRPTQGISLTFRFQICVVLVSVLKGHMTGTDGRPLTRRDFGLASSVV